MEVKLTDKELTTIHSALQSFWAVAKTEYNEYKKEYGDDDLITKSAEEYYISAIEALLIMDRHLGLDYGTNLIQAELEGCNRDDS